MFLHKRQIWPIVFVMLSLSANALRAQDEGKGKPPPPKAFSVSISSSDVFCNSTTVSLDATPSGGTGPTYSYEWSTGGTGASENVYLSQDKTISVTATDDGTLATAIDSIEIDALPNLSYTGPNPVCAKSPVSLTATGANTYTWYDNWSPIGSGSPLQTSFPSVQPYFIKLVGEDANSCRDTLEFVMDTKNSPDTELPTDTFLCENSKLTLNGTSSVSGSNYYYWSFEGQDMGYDSTANTISLAHAKPSDSGMYTLTVAMNWGGGMYCYDYDSTLVNVRAAPDVQAPPDQDFCNRELVKVWHKGNDTSLATDWSLVGPNQVSFDEYGDTIQFVRPELDYDYYFMLAGTDSMGCTGYDTTVIGEFERPDPIIHTPGEYLCEGERALFSVEKYDRNGDLIAVYWSKADSWDYEQELTINQGFASEAVVIYNSSGCEFKFYPNVTVLSTSSFEIDAQPDTICKGESAKLKFSGATNIYHGSRLLDSIYYVKPKNTRYYRFRAEKVYTKYDKTCSITDSIQVRVNTAGDPPVVDSLGTYYEGMNPGPISASGENLTWYNDYGVVYSRDSVLDLPYLRAGTYTYSVTQKQNGCESDPSPVVIKVEDFSGKTIANTITPNGDGYNDYFTIDKIEEFINNSLTIYDRHGRAVYRSSPYQNDWNGTRGTGKALPAGTYFWVLSINNGQIALHGDITILR
jgi:gliding motility-associated-like protein